ELPFDANWAVGMAVLGLAAAGLGEREASGVLYDLLAPYEDTVITVGMPADVIGPIHAPLAVLAAAIGRWDDFERHLAAGVGWLDANGGLPWRTRFQLLAAAVLLESGRPKDTERARRLLEEAKDTSRTIGMPYMEARADTLLAQL